MTRKLGEILVDGKALSPADLKRALDAQAAFGGRLGTNLLDFGFLDEATLSKALEEQKRVKVATTEMFERVTKDVLRLVPARVAGRQKVLPLELADRKLKVAMLDPGDLIVLDELVFTTGCQIVPLIAPEVRLLAYLDRYYGIARPKRFIKIAGADATVPGSAPSAAEFEPLRWRPVDAPELEALSPEGEKVVSEADFHGSEAAGAASLASAGVAARNAGPAVHEELAEPEPVATVEDAARMLAESDTRDEIGDVLVAFTQHRFSRVMTFIFQKDRALGWLARLPGHSVPRSREVVRSVVVPFDQPSVLQGVATTGEYYMGELPHRPGDDMLAVALGEPRPLSVVVLPVMLHEKAIIGLCADNAGKPITALDLRALRSACQKAALAMEVLLLRAKIRQVG